MSYVDVDAIPAEPNHVSFVGRLLRFWDSNHLESALQQIESSATWDQGQQPIIKEDNESMGTNLIFLDEQCSVIHAFIPSAYTSQFRNILCEGVIFNVGGFEVGRCTRLCKIIRFLSTTTMVEVADSSGRIAKLKRLLHQKPTVGELHYLRILLNNVKGATSFEHLKTVGGVVHETFKEACYARGLIDGDN